jgi:lariat debranching enzyme
VSALFAVAGDVHGAFDALHVLLRRFEEERGEKLDFVLQVGDLEPHRDKADVATMSAPVRNKKAGDFPRYFRGERKLERELIFIGGNHEPYGWLEEFQDGGVLAPNLTYLGRAGAVERKGLRIAGLSGIHHGRWSKEESRAPREELEGGSLGWKQATWITREDERRALALGRADILLLHEWPEGLLPEDEELRPVGLLEDDDLGSPEGKLAIETLRPKLVFCGHMHVRFSGTIAGAPVQALANVAAGRSSLAFVRWDGSKLEVLEG